MNKVIVERSRRGGSYSKNGRKPKKLEDYPKKESMRKKWRDRKSLNENLKPLERYLRSKIGENWDKIYSDICRNLSPKNAVQQHVKDHVFDLVSKHVIIDENKKVLTIKKYGGNYRELNNNDLYICPLTGNLKKYKNSDSYKKREKDRLKKLFNDELNQLSKHNSKLVFEDNILYKLFFDKFTDDYTIRVVANQTHAINDFDAVWTYRKKSIISFFKYYKIDEKNPYFSKYLELITKRLEEDSKKKKYVTPYSVGQKISFSKDSGKTWTDGIINRIDNINNEGYESFWVTVNDKNIHLGSRNSFLNIQIRPFINDK